MVDLLQELLSAIGSCLNSNPIDILLFRAVYKSWSSPSISPPSCLISFLLPQRLPSQTISLRSDFCFLSFIFSILSATAVYTLRPRAKSAKDSLSTPKTWVLFVDQLSPGEKWVDITILFMVLPVSASLLDQVLGPKGFLRWFFSRMGQLLLYSLRMGNWLLRLGAEEDVMNAEWEILHEGKGFRFDDVMEYNGRFLGIDRMGHMYEMDDYFSGMNMVVTPVRKGGGRR